MNIHDLIYQMDEEDTNRLAEIYKLLGSPSRLKLLLKLTEGEWAVGDLASGAGLSPSAASHQLKELKLSRVVKSRKDGQAMLYSLHDSHIIEILAKGVEHIKGENCDE